MARTAQPPHHSRLRGQHRRRRPFWAAVAVAAAVAMLLAPIAYATEQKLTAADGASNDQFGTSVAIAGDTMVVGARNDDVGANADQGSVHVFVRSGDVWTQQQVLTAGDGAAFDRFGSSVAIDGDTMIVGAVDDDIGAFGNHGSAYVFVRSGGVWTQQQHLFAGDAAQSDEFGASVAVDGDTVVVGAPRDDFGAIGDQGSAYVFVRSGGVWTEQQKVTAGTPLDQLGRSVAIAGDTVVVGAPFDDIELSFAGSAYVFVRSGGVWTLQRRLTASDRSSDDRLGVSVAIDGDTVIAGAHLDNVGPNVDQGSAYVFVRSGGVWTQQQKLTGVDGAAADRFGASVSIAGDTALVGAPLDDVGTNVDQGSAYAFVRSGGAWTQQRKLTADDGAAGDVFGSSISIDGNSVVVGAPLNTGKGAAYFFELVALPAAVALFPPDDVNDVGTSHAVTATVTDAGGQPVADIIVRFSVTGSVSASGSCLTDSNGQCSFEYAGPALPGADSISAYADTDEDGVQDADEPAGEATKSWVLPSSTPGQASGGGNIDDGGDRVAFGFSARSGDNGFQGSCHVVDHAAHVMLRCSDVTALVINGNTATVFGNATVNGVATTYRIDAVDNADPGRDADTFSIQTESGYSSSGVLTSGNIDVG